MSPGGSTPLFFSLYILKRYRDERLIFSRSHYSISVQFLLSLLCNFCYHCISDSPTQGRGGGMKSHAHMTKASKGPP